MSSEEEMYVLLGTATATKGNGKYPEGERHGVLAFTKARSHEDVEKIAQVKMAEIGWTIELHKSGVIDPVASTSEQNRTEIDNAMKDGFSVLIYGDIEP